MKTNEVIQWVLIVALMIGTGFQLKLNSKIITVLDNNAKSISTLAEIDDLQTDCLEILMGLEKERMKNEISN